VQDLANSGETMRTVRVTGFAVLAAYLLVACAGPSPNVGSMSASTVLAAQPALGPNASAEKLPRGYRHLKKDGKDYICERQATTGSRTAIDEICLTEAEFAARTKDGQDALQAFKEQVLPAALPSGRTFTPGF